MNVTAKDSALMITCANILCRLASADGINSQHSFLPLVSLA